VRITKIASKPSIYNLKFLRIFSGLKLIFVGASSSRASSHLSELLHHIADSPCSAVPTAHRVAPAQPPLGYLEQHSDAHVEDERFLPWVPPHSMRRLDASNDMRMQAHIFGVSSSSRPPPPCSLHIVRRLILRFYMLSLITF
jgi:hypothetical protein